MDNKIFITMFCSASTIFKDATLFFEEGAKQFKKACVELFAPHYLASIPSDDPNSTTIDQIPKEILMLIFNYCIPNTLFRMRTVCSHWLTLTQDESFWKREFSKLQGIMAFVDTIDSRSSIEQQCYLMWNLKKEMGTIRTITTAKKLAKHHKICLQKLKENTFYLFYYHPQTAAHKEFIHSIPFFQLSWKNDSGENHWKLTDFSAVNQKIKELTSQGMKRVYSVEATDHIPLRHSWTILW